MTATQRSRPVSRKGLTIGQMSFDDLIGQYSENIPVERGHYVYRLWAADGTCLYVGCTGTWWPRSVPERLHEHKSKGSPTRRWFVREVARVDCAPFVSSVEALAEELRQMTALQPIHNKQGMPGRVNRNRNIALKCGNARGAA